MSSHPLLRPHPPEVIEKVKRLLYIHPNPALSELPKIWSDTFGEKLDYLAAGDSNLSAWARRLPPDSVLIVKPSNTTITYLRLTRPRAAPRASVIHAQKPSLEKSSLNEKEAEEMKKLINQNLKARHIQVDVPSLRCSHCNKLMIDICMLKCGHCIGSGCARNRYPFQCDLAACRTFIAGPADLVPVMRLGKDYPISELEDVLMHLPVLCYGRNCSWTGPKSKLILHVPVCPVLAMKGKLFGSVKKPPAPPKSEDNEFERKISKLLKRIHQQYFVPSEGPVVTGIVSLADPPEGAPDDQAADGLDGSPEEVPMATYQVVAELEVRFPHEPHPTTDPREGAEDESEPFHITLYLPLRVGDRVQVIQSEHNSLYGYCLGRRECYPEEMVPTVTDKVIRSHRMGWFPTVCFAEDEDHLAQVGKRLFASEFNAQSGTPM